TTPAAGTTLPPPAKSRKKIKAVALAIVLAVLILGAGSAAAYVGYYLPNKPENVLGKALVNTFSKDVTSVAFEGELSAEDKNGKAAAGASTFSGATAASGAFQLKADVDLLVTTISADLRSTDGKSLFVKVGGLKGLDGMLGESESMYGPLIQQVDNQWFEVNESLIKQATQNKLDTKLSDADRQKLTDAYKAHQFLVVTDALSGQSIKGVACYHYKLGIDKTELKAFAKAVKDAKVETLKLDDTDLSRFNKEVGSANFNRVKTDIWITKNDKKIKQLLATGTEDNQTYALRFTIIDYNKQVKVDKPSGAKSIMELLGPILGSDAEDSTTTQTLMNDVQGLSTVR
ncbi:MAG TPA: hypothetical protein VLF43_00115, partial [Candidatus Saccharimonadales bacterium]|nr:hypothetical protein [Candidatus Saccharimonadales bacterium]